MIIDSHVHLSMSKDGLHTILKACDKLGVEKVCLLAPYKNLKPAFREAPDRVVPVAAVDIDREQSSFIHLLVDNGIKGLKMTRPQFPYDHEQYHPFYATAEEYDLPILFHTGIVAGRTAKSINENMRPIHLDHLARTFQKLKLIMAHLGNPWQEEGAMAVRHNENLYFDLTGSSLKRYAPAFFRDLLWWGRPNHPYKPGGGKHPLEKLLYGTDVAPDWIKDTWNDYQQLLKSLKATKEQRRKIMGATAAELYHLAE